MARRTSQHLLVVCSLLTLAGCSSSAEAPNLEPIGSTSSAITANDVLARAEQWVAVKLPYCQAANHQHDDDSACASTCTRPDNPEWDDYRSDCSGFVSWSWGLPAPGRVTWELAPAQTDVTSTINAIDLQPGDAVNKPHDHTMLFKAWIVPGKRASFLEEPGCSSATPYAHQLDSDVTISGTSITVAANGITFDAIHFHQLQASPPDAGGTPDAGAGSDATPPDPTGHDAGAPDAPTSAPDPGEKDPPEPGAAPASNQGDFGSARGQGGCASSPGAPTSSGVPVLLALVGLLSARRRGRAGAGP
jgi:MYXO-CTERM domain-containing protein